MIDLSSIPREKFPKHIAIIMDGNGRWAVQRGLERVRGHQQGARVVRTIVTDASKLLKDFGGPTHLTLYSFSIENWKRPASEVEFLMQMYIDYLQQERITMMENNIRYRQIGRLDQLPPAVQDETLRTLEETAANTGLTLTLALNYGSRAEIVDAMQSIAKQIEAGSLKPHEIDEQLISDHLYTHGMPDPDLLIRTAGEMRISNYLLWQISYAELYVSKLLWPDFDPNELHTAIANFASRNRRFGALDKVVQK